MTQEMLDQVPSQVLDWEEDKESSGSSRSRTKSSSLQPVSLTTSSGYLVNAKSEKEDSITGRSFVRSQLSARLEASGRASDPIMLSSPTPQAPMRTSLKTKPPFQTQGLNLGAARSLETTNETGMTSGWPRNPDNSTEFPQMYVLLVTGPYGLLSRIMRQQYLWYDGRWCTGVQQQLENPKMPGAKQEWQLMLKIHGPSSGMDTLVIQTLSSMNFVEELMLPTFSDGLTVIQSEWILKGRQSRSAQRASGSLPISPRGNGGLNLTKTPTLPWSVDLK